MAIHNYLGYTKDDLENKSTWVWNRKYFVMLSGTPSGPDGEDLSTYEEERHWSLAGFDNEYWVEPLPAEGMLFLINSMGYEKIFRG